MSQISASDTFMHGDRAPTLGCKAPIATSSRACAARRSEGHSPGLRGQTRELSVRSCATAPDLSVSTVSTRAPAGCCCRSATAHPGAMAICRAAVLRAPFPPWAAAGPRARSVRVRFVYQRGLLLHLLLHLSTGPRVRPSVAPCCSTQKREPAYLRSRARSERGGGSNALQHRHFLSAI